MPNPLSFGPNGLNFSADTDPAQLAKQVADLLARIADGIDPPIGWQIISIAQPGNNLVSFDNGATLRPGELMSGITVSSNPFNWILSNIFPFNGTDALNIWLNKKGVSHFNEQTGISGTGSTKDYNNVDVVLGNAFGVNARAVPLQVYRTIDIQADVNNADFISGNIVLARL